MTNEKIAALIAMAERGTEHEAANARRILETLGVEDDDFDSFRDSVEMVSVKVAYRTADEKSVLLALATKFFDGSKMYTYYKREKCFYIETPKKDVDRFKAQVKTILNAYRKELEALRIAFIHANDLYSSKPRAVSDDDEKKKPSFTDEEIEAIRRHVRASRKVILDRQLGS